MLDDVERIVGILIGLFLIVGDGFDPIPDPSNVKSLRVSAFLQWALELLLLSSQPTIAGAESVDGLSSLTVRVGDQRSRAVFVSQSSHTGSVDMDAVSVMFGPISLTCTELAVAQLMPVLLQDTLSVATLPSAKARRVVPRTSVAPWAPSKKALFSLKNRYPVALTLSCSTW